MRVYERGGTQLGKSEVTTGVSVITLHFNIPAQTKRNFNYHEEREDKCLDQMERCALSGQRDARNE